MKFLPSYCFRLGIAWLALAPLTWAVADFTDRFEHQKLHARWHGVAASPTTDDDALTLDEGVVGHQQFMELLHWRDGGLELRGQNDQSLSLRTAVPLPRLRQLSLAFTINKAPESTSRFFNFGIRWPGHHQAVVLDEENRRRRLRYHGTQHHHYGGPGWQAGKRYVVTFALDAKALRVLWQTGDGAASVYQWQARPQDLDTGEFFIEKASAQDALDFSITLHEATASFWTPDEWRRLEEAERAQQQAQQATAERTRAWRASIRGQAKVPVQFWDVHKLRADEALIAELAARGDIVQNLKRDLIPEAATFNLQYAYYPKVLHWRPAAGKDGESPYRKPRYLDPQYIDDVVSQLEQNVGELESRTSPLRIMPVSEYYPLPADTALVRAAAESANVLPSTAPFPKIGAKGTIGPPKGVIADDDPAYRLIRWWYDQSGLTPLYEACRERLSKLDAKHVLITDPIADRGGLGQFRHTDVIQHWIRVHFAPRHPLSVAYYAERARVHQRHGGQAICIGPQLGNDQLGAAATPSAMFAEACWLALAFGATEITHWGLQYVYEAKGRFAPGGHELWQMMERINRELYTKHGELLTSWQPQRRRAAFWMSQCDSLHSGYTKAELGDTWQITEGLYRALLLSGEPFDIVYDDEVRAGILANYELVVTSRLRTTTAALHERVEAFIDGGGTMLVPQGRLGIEIDGVRMFTVPAGPVGLQQLKGGGDPASYDAHLAATADAVLTAAGVEPQVRIEPRHAVANLLTADNERYLVLVNNHRTYGPWAATHNNRALDAGLPAQISVVMPGVERLVDVGSGEAITGDEGRFALTIPAGWGRIFKY